MRSHRFWFILCLISLASGPPLSAADAVSFRNDVMAVLSKAGCNLGTCHGNQNGKGGFKLSLRGQDPKADFEVLTRDFSNRRTNPMQPDASLILLKPTMQVPHEGGRRFDVESIEYEILREWIAARLPADRDDTPQLTQLEVTPTGRVLVDPEEAVALRAEAIFSDGARRDVTRLAVYEVGEPIVDVTPGGLVRRLDFGETVVTVRFLDRQVPVRLAFVPARSDFVWSAPEPANSIDEHVFAKLRQLRINPSAVCDDTTFIRRAYLDLIGMLPTTDETRRFVADDRQDKRKRLIDELLQRPEFAEFWAVKWADLLRAEEKTLDQKGVENYYAWIRAAIARGKPMDEFVRELIAARGSTYTNPAANYYRSMREPLMRAESTAQLFLGIRLQCAKCHNHPFDRWTQDDYYGWANLFARVDYKVLENNRSDRNDKHEFDGEQIVYVKSKGEVEHPLTGKPQPPQFLADGSVTVDPGADRLRQLADWITRPDNERFTQTMVNRVWNELTGRGIVDPIDDFRATNPPSHPELLDWLARDFVEHGFDLRHSVRTIMRSKTYQLAAEPNETNAEDERNFSRAYVRRLSAEQILDSLSGVLELPIEYSGYPAGMRAGELPGVQAMRFRRRQTTPADEFLRLFGKPPRLETCECERSDESTLNQTFELVSGPFINDLLTRSGGRLDRLAETSPDVAVEELYWAALSRTPSTEELSQSVEYLQSSEDRRRAVEDLAWAVLNSKEFLLRR